jgi:hypothetical protein
MTAKTYKATPIVGLLVSAAFSLGCDAVFGIEGGQLSRITANTTWTKDSKPTLKGVIFVEDGATLTIAPGTTVLADPASALVVKQGGKLDACGTKEAPIVFTSSQSSPKAGDWGGLAIAGKARMNSAKLPPAEGLPGMVGFGGAIDDDSSGQLCFVRIEFGGGEIVGRELDPLALRGVGSNTKIDHVHVHGATNDSVLILGGTVGLKYVLVTGGGEDNGIKWEGGWRGKAQFLAVVMTLTQEGNGLEGKNDGASGEVVTDPTIYNATVVGQNVYTADHGVEFSEGAKGQFWNMLVMNFRETSLDFADVETIANAKDNSLNIQSSAFSNTYNFIKDSDTDTRIDPTFDPDLWARDSARKNFTISTDIKILQDIAPDTPNLAVVAGNPRLLSDGEAPPDDGFFDPSVTFVGVCGQTCAEFEGWTWRPRQ